MEVEESDNRKARGRRSRNNSGNTKDPKSEIMKGANGNVGGKHPEMDSLPNGDEPSLDRVRSQENSEGGVRGKENSNSLRENSSSSPAADKSGKDDVSPLESTNGDENFVKKSSKKRARSVTNSESDEDFTGFDSSDETERDPGLTFLQNLIGKYENDEVVSDDELTEEERDYFQRSSQEYSSDAYWSGASSPTKIDGMTDPLGDDLCSSNASSPSVASGFSGDAKTRGKKSHNVDLSNPAFRKPLEMGWRRELVFRKMSDTSQKRLADVYYYTPAGKKVRSAREVSEYLAGTDLTDDNFTFFKMALGLNDPSKEIIRDAKLRESSGTPPHKIPKLSKTSKNDGVPKGVGSGKEDATASTKAAKIFSKGTFPRIKVTPVRGGQQASPGRPRPLGRPKKSSLALAEGEMEIGMLPPTWKETSAVSGALNVTSPSTPVPTRISAGRPTANGEIPADMRTRYPLVVVRRCDFDPPGHKRSKLLRKILLKRQHKNATPKKDEGYVGMPVSSDNNFMQYFMQNVSAGYTALHHVFQYLKVQDLLRAGRVCRMWYDLAGHPSLWKTVRMKNSLVLDWDGCATMLSQHGTQHLDLRKMLLDAKSQDVWNKFCTAIGRITSLRHLDLCRCSSSVVERVVAQCPQLTNLTALFISDPNLDLKSLRCLPSIQELRLKGANGLKLKASLNILQEMTSLRHLSLTTVKDLGKAGPETLKSLTQLESLELGECNDLSETFGSECLPCLKKLTRLRLEMGQQKCPTFVILNGVHSLPLLTHLELVNFDIKPGFDKALAQCTNIKRLLLIPTYLTQSATTNHMVLGGVTKLSENLVQFVWGVTHELLHVTELFVDQCEGQKGGTPKGSTNASGGNNGGNGPNSLQQPFPSGKKSGTGDSIPILRPVPGDILSGGDFKPEEEDASKPSPQVDILPLSQLQKLLAASLPNTKVNILKIPFSATWRQTLGEVGH